MSLFGNAADEIIKRAMQEGAFDNLPGKGQPLKLDDNPHEAGEWRIAYNLLKSNGYSLPWLDLRKEIEEAIVRARADAVDAWQSEDTRIWQKHQPVFSQRIEALNRRIFHYNLQTPSPLFHRPVLNLAHELELIQADQRTGSNTSRGR